MNFFSGVITDRAVSLFQFVGVKKIEHIINTLIEQIPDEIPIPGTDVYF